MNSQFLKEMTEHLPFWAQVRLSGPLGLWKGTWRVEGEEGGHRFRADRNEVLLSGERDSIVLRGHDKKIYYADFYKTWTEGGHSRSQATACVILDIKKYKKKTYTGGGKLTRSHQLTGISHWKRTFNDHSFWRTSKQLIRKFNNPPTGARDILNEVPPELHQFLRPLIEACVWKPVKT